MPFLVDGSNLAGAARDHRLGLPRDEQELVRRLADFAESRRTSLRVVFDGPAAGRGGAGRARRAGRVAVLYSGSGRIADDLIVDLVRSNQSPSDLIVVTSDRDLRSRVRAAGARVMGCAEFSETLKRAGSARHREEKPLPGDIEEWERFFEQGRDESEE